MASYFVFRSSSFSPAAARTACILFPRRLVQPATHRDVWQPHVPDPQLPREADWVQDYEGRVSQPVQDGGAGPGHGEGVKRVPAPEGMGSIEGALRSCRRQPKA